MIYHSIRSIINYRDHFISATTTILENAKNIYFCFVDFLYLFFISLEKKEITAHLDGIFIGWNKIIFLFSFCFQ